METSFNDLVREGESLLGDLGDRIWQEDPAIPRDFDLWRAKARGFISSVFGKDSDELIRWSNTFVSLHKNRRGEAARAQAERLIEDAINLLVEFGYSHVEKPYSPMQGISESTSSSSTDMTTLMHSG